MLNSDMYHWLASVWFHRLFYFLKGVGAMYVRRRPRVRLDAPMSGGGQERGMRSGTLPTPLCVGIGAACELAMQEMEVSLNEEEFFSSAGHNVTFYKNHEILTSQK